MKKLSPIATVFFVSILLTGCGTNQEEEVIDNSPSNGMENRADEENHGSNIVPEENIENNKIQAGDNDNKMTVADEAIDRIVQLENVDSATVIVTNQNAYVAAVLKETTDGEGTDTLETKIADEVKATDDNIQNVYVSVNPEFTERMTEYGQKINAGEPVEGFFEEFTETVQRIFPDAR